MVSAISVNIAGNVSLLSDCSESSELRTVC